MTDENKALVAEARQQVYRYPPGVKSRSLLDQLATALEASEARAEAAMAMLKRLVNEYDTPCCPICGCLGDVCHSADCELAALLRCGK